MRHFRSALRVLVLMVLTLSGSVPARAGMSETWIHTGWLTSQDVGRWSKISGIRDYVIRLPRAEKQQLEALLKLKKAASLTIESESYPEAGDVELWTGLSTRFPGLKLRFLDLQLPGAEEIDILNRTRAASLEWIITYFPDPEESLRLDSLQAPVSIEFRTPFLPRYEEKELLLAIPARVPLTFVSNLWPWYHHMDLMNMIPHVKCLKIQEGSYPSGAQWDYLNNIHDLGETTVISEFAPPSDDTWDQFRNGPVTWIYRAGVPQLSELQAFEQSSRSGIRRLVIESESDLAREDLARLAGIKVPVIWKHPAPRE